jgi:tripartite ATP-independent transporter DctM subunit
MTMVWLLGGLFFLLAIRVPVSFALLLPSMVYVGLEPRISLGVAMQRAAALLDSFPLLAVPLFILVGYVANAAGLADRLIQALLALVGRVKGSLAYVNLNASLVFSWMSGSAMADAAAMGSVLVPAMRRNGYDPAFAAAITGAASMLGPVMPPSVGAVVYAVLTGTSIAALFAAGVVPALLIFFALAVYVFFYVRRREGLTVERMPRREAVRACVAALPILLAPVLLLGGILGGIFTPTEASGITVAYLILMSLVAGWLTLPRLYLAFRESAVTTGRVMLIAAAGGLFSYVLSRENVPAQIADFLQGISTDPYVFLLLLNVILLVIGTVLEPAAGMLITVPVFFPIAVEYGIDPVQLGIIVVFNLSIGLLTPPIGLVLVVLSSVGSVPPRDVMRATWPLMIPLVIALLLITYVPWLTAILPRLVGY